MGIIVDGLTKKLERGKHKEKRTKNIVKAG